MQQYPSALVCIVIVLLTLVNANAKSAIPHVAAIIK